MGFAGIGRWLASCRRKSSRRNPMRPRAIPGRVRHVDLQHSARHEGHAKHRSLRRRDREVRRRIRRRHPGPSRLRRVGADSRPRPARHPPRGPELRRTPARARPAAADPFEPDRLRRGRDQLIRWGFTPIPVRSLRGPVRETAASDFLPRWMTKLVQWDSFAEAALCEPAAPPSPRIHTSAPSLGGHTTRKFAIIPMLSCSSWWQWITYAPR